jgi:hypothetical protein
MYLLQQQQERVVHKAHAVEQQQLATLCSGPDSVWVTRTTGTETM